MAAPFSGEWRRANLVPYSGPGVWGTGINAVHYYYGSPDTRLNPVRFREGEYTAAYMAVPEELTAHELWGYTPDRSVLHDVEYDGRPGWDEQPTSYRADTRNHPSWIAPGIVNERFRRMMDGAHRITQKLADSLPTETVSEGWVNKAHGAIADAKPSDPLQYERQTSMQQRYQTRVNDHAVSRATDEPRSPIQSLVTGQKVKEYSGGERHYDMYPKEQTEMPRPFYYRTAGTGRAWEMRPNTMWTTEAIERIPPPDPSLGTPETDFSNDYGYTDEDLTYGQ